MSRRTFAGGVCLAIGLLVGCASGGAPRGDRAAAEFAQRELGVALQWNQTQSSRVASQTQTDQLLAAPLAADDAVRIALGTNPRLQRLLAAYAASEADARQVGRAPNPLFTFERLTADGAVEIDRKLAISLIDLLQWPGRRGLSRSLQQQADMRAATDILGLATDARRAWIEAVGAQQSLQYAEQVHAAADAGATLAGRMAEGGNFAAVEQAREHAFLADATAELTRARFAATQKREQLVRMLGLRTEQADRLVLPGALPELPLNRSLKPSCRAAHSMSDWTLGWRARGSTRRRAHWD
jgi:outer membrane protein TolC